MTTIRKGLLVLLGAWACVALFESIAWSGTAGYVDSFEQPAPPMAHDLTSLRAACGAPLVIKPAGDSQALVRCGMWWPAATVWRVPRSEIHSAESASVN